MERMGQMKKCNVMQRGGCGEEGESRVGGGEARDELEGSTARGWALQGMAFVRRSLRDEAMLAQLLRGVTAEWWTDEPTNAQVTDSVSWLATHSCVLV